MSARVRIRHADHGGHAPSTCARVLDARERGGRPDRGPSARCASLRETVAPRGCLIHHFASFDPSATASACADKALGRGHCVEILVTSGPPGGLFGSTSLAVGITREGDVRVQQGRLWCSGFPMISGDRGRWTLVRSGLLGAWVYQGLQYVVGRVKAGAAGGAAATAAVGPWCGAVCSVPVRIKVAESGGDMGRYARLSSQDVVTVSGGRDRGPSAGLLPARRPRSDGSPRWRPGRGRYPRSHSNVCCRMASVHSRTRLPGGQELPRSIRLVSDLTRIRRPLRSWRPSARSATHVSKIAGSGGGMSRLRGLGPRCGLCARYAGARFTSWTRCPNGRDWKAIPTGRSGQATPSRHRVPGAGR